MPAALALGSGSVAAGRLARCRGRRGLLLRRLLRLRFLRVRSGVQGVLPSSADREGERDDHGDQPGADRRHRDHPPAATRRRAARGGQGLVHRPRAGCLLGGRGLGGVGPGRVGRIRGERDRLGRLRRWRRGGAVAEALELGERGRGRRRASLRSPVAHPVDQRPQLGIGAAGRDVGEQDAERVEVRALARRIAAQHLWCEVGLGADHMAGAGQRGGTVGLGDAEVGQPRMPLGVDQDVVRLDIAVKDSRRVDVAKRGEELGGERRRVDRLAARDPLGERAAIDVLHHQIGALAGVEVVDADEVRVLKARRQGGLAPEAAQELAIAGDRVGEDLDRDLSVEALVGGEPDRGHPAAPDRSLEPVAAPEPAPGCEQRAARRRARRRAHTPVVARRVAHVRIPFPATGPPNPFPPCRGYADRRGEHDNRHPGEPDRAFRQRAGGVDTARRGQLAGLPRGPHRADRAPQPDPERDHRAPLRCRASRGRCRRRGARRGR